MTACFIKGFDYLLQTLFARFIGTATFFFYFLNLKYASYAKCNVQLC